MICTFFGHRDAPDNIRNLLKSTVLTLINKNGVKKFYIGNNGNFDFLAQSILEEVVKSETSVEYFIVISTLGEKVVFGNRNNTLFPEGLETALPKFAISKRNDWLIKNADFAITYVRNSYSNAYKLATKAKKKGLTVINLYDQI